mmetsp:Transcript_61760/g.179148  ORF Transcript_61760/g.179148 Transcript_61760/m.179148 type:complete len:259 (-) Transcript_61760:235-1011(-)
MDPTRAAPSSASLAPRHRQVRRCARRNALTRRRAPKLAATSSTASPPRRRRQATRRARPLTTPRPRRRSLARGVGRRAPWSSASWTTSLTYGPAPRSWACRRRASTRCGMPTTVASSTASRPTSCARGRPRWSSRWRSGPASALASPQTRMTCSTLRHLSVRPPPRTAPAPKCGGARPTTNASGAAAPAAATPGRPRTAPCASRGRASRRQRRASPRSTGCHGSSASSSRRNSQSGASARTAWATPPANRLTPCAARR